MDKNQQLMEQEEQREEKEAVPKKRRPELNAVEKLRRLKRGLITLVVVLVAALLAMGFMWSRGKKQGEEKAEAEIAALKEQMAQQADQIKKLEEEPIVVNPVAPEISLDIVNSEIREIGELATMEYLYTNAAKFSDAKQIKNWNIPLTKKTFILKWDGAIKAGIDVNEIRTELDQEKKVITIQLPEAKILSHDPDRDSVEVLDESDGLFNPVNLNDQVKFDAASEKEMEQRAIENGLLEKAQKNAGEVISRLLNANPVIEENYTIEFKTAAGGSK